MNPAAGTSLLDKDDTETRGSIAPSGRGRLGQALGVQVAATGSYVPEQVVTNEDLAALGCDSDWIVRRSGIRERRRAAEDQATSDLAYEAAIRCMKRAGVTADQIDLILVATITPDHLTPSTACHVQRRLGAIAPAIDINAACAGFMYGLITGAQFITSGNARRVLVIGADVMSRTVNPDDKKTFPLFGDAAGAALIVPDAPTGSGILSYTLGSEGCGGQMLCIPAGGSRQPLTPDAWDEGGQYLNMDGRGVFKWAVRTIAESCSDVLHDSGLTPLQMQQVILHQANQRIIDSAVSDLGFRPEALFVNLDAYGNTSAASVPLALDESVEAGNISRGDYVLMSGFGAGLAWGTAVFRW